MLAILFLVLATSAAAQVNVCPSQVCSFSNTTCPPVPSTPLFAYVVDAGSLNTNACASVTGRSCSSSGPYALSCTNQTLDGNHLIYPFMISSSSNFQIAAYVGKLVEVSCTGPTATYATSMGPITALTGSCTVANTSLLSQNDPACTPCSIDQANVTISHNGNLQTTFDGSVHPGLLSALAIGQTLIWTSTNVSPIHSGLVVSSNIVTYSVTNSSMVTVTWSTSESVPNLFNGTLKTKSPVCLASSPASAQQ